MIASEKIKLLRLQNIDVGYRCIFVPVAPDWD
jgi:hypothetical protein